MLYIQRNRRRLKPSTAPQPREPVVVTEPVREVKLEAGANHESNLSSRYLYVPQTPRR